MSKCKWPQDLSLLVGLLALGSISSFAECTTYEFSKSNSLVEDVEICADIQRAEGAIKLSNFNENLNATAHSNDPIGSLYHNVTVI